MSDNSPAMIKLFSTGGRGSGGRTPAGGLLLALSNGPTNWCKRQSKLIAFSSKSSRTCHQQKHHGEIGGIGAVVEVSFPAEARQRWWPPAISVTLLCLTGHNPRWRPFTTSGSSLTLGFQNDPGQRAMPRDNYSFPSGGPRNR